MTEKVYPSMGRRADPYVIASNISLAGASEGWVVPEDEDYIAHRFTDIDEEDVIEFDAEWSSSSLTVQIHGGEGFAGGAAVVSDESYDVELNEEEADQVVGIGWNKDSGDTLIVDIEENIVNDNHYLPVWSFSTDEDGVIDDDDLRVFEPKVDRPNTLYDAEMDGERPVSIAEIAEDAEQLGGYGPSDYLRAANDEVVTGEWTFDGTMKVDGFLKFEPFASEPDEEETPEYGIWMVSP